LIENNRFTLENAQAVNESRERMNENRLEIQRAANDLDFYGVSLRENGTLSESEAEAMIEPFNNLAEHLEEDFLYRANGVYDAFKLASKSVAKDLGVDIAEVSSILTSFRNQHLENRSAAQEAINDYLNAVMDGDEVSENDTQNFQKRMEYFRELQAATSEAAKEYEQLYTNIKSVDFGSNYEEGLAELKRLKEYKETYTNELRTASLTLEGDFKELERIAKIDLRYGDITQDDFDIYAKTLNTARDMVKESYTQDIDNINNQVAGITLATLLQLREATGAIEDTPRHALFEFIDNQTAIFKSFGNGFDVQDSYAETVWGKDLHEAVRFAEELLEEAGLEVALSSAVDVEQLMLQLEMINSGIDDFTVSPVVIPIKPTVESLSGRLNAEVTAGTVDVGAAMSDMKTLFGIGARAEGGFIGSPELSWIGEDGPEYVIPVGANRRQRGADLWTQAGQSLGLLRSDSSGGGGLRSAPPISITYNPTITEVSGVDDLEAVLRQHSETVCVMVMNALSERELNERRMAYD
jgi:tellurite resistance protein